VVDLHPVTVLGISALKVELSVDEKRRADIRTDGRQDIPTVGIRDGDADQVYRDALPCGGVVDRLVVHLHGSHPSPASARQQLELVATRDLS
jgi:hypothetical protein